MTIPTDELLKVTVSADKFASHRLLQQQLTVVKAVERGWSEINDRIDKGFMISTTIIVNIKDREHFPDHDQKVAQLLIERLNKLGYWARVTNYNETWIRIKWSHKKPCSLFPWHPPTPQLLEKYE